MKPWEPSVELGEKGQLIGKQLKRTRKRFAFVATTQARVIRRRVSRCGRGRDKGGRAGSPCSAVHGADPSGVPSTLRGQVARKLVRCAAKITGPSTEDIRVQIAEDALQQEIRKLQDSPAGRARPGAAAWSTAWRTPLRGRGPGRPREYLRPSPHGRGRETARRFGECKNGVSPSCGMTGLSTRPALSSGPHLVVYSDRGGEWWRKKQDIRGSGS